MVDMPRVLVYDRLDQYLCDIDPQQVLEMPYTEAINGEHSLTIRTTQKLEKTNRLLLQDGTGEWHEYVVLGIDDTHAESEYYCVWSLEYDLSGTFINGPYDCGVVPGHASVPQLPRRAMEVSLGDTTRWVIGTITVTTMAAASFYRRSGWEGLQTVLERWGGELHASIGVDSTGVISRAVDLLAHEGTEEPTRRFDYGHDVTGITRTISDDVWPCRIVPLGKSSETEAGGYTRRPSIESVNGGILWLQDDDAVPLVRVMNPQGEWEYPTSIIRNDTYEDPAALKEWALENISDYTRPKVSYTATVAQFARAGLNPHGVRLGDEIIVVDRKFRDEGLRISARVLKIKGDLLDASRTQLTIGNALPTLGGQLKGIASQVDTVAEEIARTTDWETTAGYLSNLLGRLNTEANMTGGYTYITQGEGLRTYDTPVSDPLVGAEASKVVEVKGGNIRIADSRTSGGDWDWRTLLVSGHIAADLVTAARLTAGFIGNAEGSCWDLDSGDFVREVTVPVLSDKDSFTYTSTHTNDNTRTTYMNPGMTYLVFFTYDGELPSDFKIGFVVESGSRPKYTSAPRKVQEISSTSSRYMASVTVPGLTGRTSTHVYISADSSFYNQTITDVKTFESPTAGGGAIQFLSESSDDSMSMKAVLTSGLLAVSVDDNTTSLIPGILRINSLPDTDGEIQLDDSDRGVYYDAETDTVSIGYRPGLDDTKGTLGIDVANNMVRTNAGLDIAGRFEADSPSAYDAGDVSTWFTAYSDVTVVSGTLLCFGIMRDLRLTFTLNSSMTLSNRMWWGPLQLGYIARGHRPRNGAQFFGSDTYSYYTMFGSTRPVPSNPVSRVDVFLDSAISEAGRTSIPSGTQITIHMTYIAE